MEEHWITIRYRSFYDVPRMMVFPHGKHLYLLDCSFDDELDDYPDFYVVYRLPDTATDRIAETEDWSELLVAGERIGVIPLSRIEFDETKRKAIKDKGLDLLV